MNILVTGGAGYLGSIASDVLLDAGHHVRVLDSLLHGGQSLLTFWHHPNFEFVFGDIRDEEVLRSSLDGIDGVVHLAAIVGDPACARDTARARAVNLQASQALLEECRKSRVKRFVFASTCSNYGQMHDEEYLDETARLSPLSVYAETKVAFEQTLLQASRSETPFVTSLRFATLYGVSPRMRFDLTINEFTLDMLKKGSLVVFGENSWRPYVHVRDAACAIRHFLQAPANESPEVFNVGATNQNFRKRELVELIQVHAPAARIEYVEQKNDLRNYRVCFEKIARQTGFRPARKVEDGIAEVARLVKSNVIGSGSDAHYRN